MGNIFQLKEITWLPFDDDEPLDELSGDTVTGSYDLCRVAAKDASVYTYRVLFTPRCHGAISSLILDGLSSLDEAKQVALKHHRQDLSLYFNIVDNNSLAHELTELVEQLERRELKLKELTANESDTQTWARLETKGGTTRAIRAELLRVLKNANIA